MTDVQGDCRKCFLLEKEVAALELLVGRYQQELTATASCTSCGRRAFESLPTEIEELFENQQLDSLQWNDSNGAIPRFTRKNGQECEFDQVMLPSSEWTWTSDWYIDVNSKTDAHGWTYATTAHDLAIETHCNSDRMMDHRARRRRWRRERKFVGSADLPSTVTSSLEHGAYLCALQNANKKLTEQLQRANNQILEYEERIRAYEAKLQHTQSTSTLKKPLRISTSLQPDPGATLFSPTKSREVLSQTEALLTQLVETGPTALDDETQAVQRRRSQMVMECQSELDNAISEFHSLIQTVGSTMPTQGA